MTILAILTKFCQKFANFVNFAMSFFCLALSALSPSKVQIVQCHFLCINQVRNLLGTPKILIFAGEEVPRMALRVLQATHRTSEAQVAPTN